MGTLKRHIAFLLLNLVAFRWLLSLLTRAESSLLWTTGTTGDGTTTYTEAQATSFWGDWFTPNTTITNPHASQGVLAGAGGELAVTGTASPVSVASGGAIVEGYPYRSTAAVTVAIPTPAASTRIDRIVLRVSHGTTRTVRITRIAGTEGAGAPAITQTAGTTWDIKLAQVSITTGGVITVTDERTFCHFATRLDYTGVDGGTSGRVPFFDSNGKLTSEANLTYDTTNDRLGVGAGASPAAVVHGKGNAPQVMAEAASGQSARVDLKDAAGTPNQWAMVGGVGTTTDGKFSIYDVRQALHRLVIDTAGFLGLGTTSPSTKLDVQGGQITVNPASATAPFVLGANAQGQLVTGLNADLLNGIDIAFNRRGGSASDFSVAGTTNYTVGNIRIQFGVFAGPSTSAGGTFGTSVTMPVAFSNKPVMFVGSKNPDFVCGATVQGDFQTIDFSGRNVNSVTSSTDFYWLAIGPA